MNKRSLLSLEMIVGLVFLGASRASTQNTQGSLEILRKAYKETLHDPAFLAEDRKSKLVVEHVPGEQIEQVVNEILSISPDAREKLQFLVQTQAKTS